MKTKILAPAIALALASAATPASADPLCDSIYDMAASAMELRLSGYATEAQLIRRLYSGNYGKPFTELMEILIIDAFDERPTESRYMRRTQIENYAAGWFASCMNR